MVMTLLDVLSAGEASQALGRRSADQTMMTIAAAASARRDGRDEAHVVVDDGIDQHGALVAPVVDDRPVVGGEALAMAADVGRSYQVAPLLGSLVIDLLGCSPSLVYPPSSLR